MNTALIYTMEMSTPHYQGPFISGWHEKPLQPSQLVDGPPCLPSTDLTESWARRRKLDTAWVYDYVEATKPKPLQFSEAEIDALQLTTTSASCLGNSSLFENVGFDFSWDSDVVEHAHGADLDEGVLTRWTHPGAFGDNQPSIVTSDWVVSTELIRADEPSHTKDALALPNSSYTPMNQITSLRDGSVSLEIACDFVGLTSDLTSDDDAPNMPIPSSNFIFTAPHPKPVISSRGLSRNTATKLSHAYTGEAYRPVPHVAPVEQLASAATRRPPVQRATSSASSSSSQATSTTSTRQRSGLKRRRNNCSYQERRTKGKFPLELVLCRVRGCQHIALSPSECMKHRDTHYPGRFYCPVCGVEHGRSDSLKRHFKLAPECRARAGPSKEWGIGMSTFMSRKSFWLEPGQLVPFHSMDLDSH